MSAEQEAPTGSVGDLRDSVGYALKQAATALRVALDRDLRPLELTVSQYSCLEVLGQRPGLSNSELARATFVTRQTMNEILRGLQARDLLTRPATATSGRSRPVELTAAGRRALESASAVVAAVEERMVTALPADRRARFLADLRHCVQALG
ncbi:MarR family winged helix-turn-helix transcriptional regulator [Actinomycetospora sp. CA-084318]|uniref:MarR family winged helix-turn-helix transcriptional regulator n=1 Tax=Actinomycetospora sp. CA-084318 TaxID=3239892 RepID=UPI003D995F03